jgi:hypothetical protein
MANEYEMFQRLLEKEAPSDGWLHSVEDFSDDNDVQEILKALKPPTPVDVCTALNKIFTEEVEYSEKAQTFYIKGKNNLFSLLTHNEKKLLRVNNRFGKIYPPEIHEIVGKFYRHLIKSEEL